MDVSKTRRRAVAAVDEGAGEISCEYGCNIRKYNLVCSWLLWGNRSGFRVGFRLSVVPIGSDMCFLRLGTVLPKMQPFH